jgi:hypothetical protein
VTASVGGDSGVLSATLGSLDGLEDRIVRVGGRVEARTQRRLTLDDGTATGTVRMSEAAGQVDPELEVGEVVNAIGRVLRRRDRSTEIVVESAADLRRASATDVRAVDPGRVVSARSGVDGAWAPEAADAVGHDRTRLLRRAGGCRAAGVAPFRPDTRPEHASGAG